MGFCGYSIYYIIVPVLYMSCFVYYLGTPDLSENQLVTSLAWLLDMLIGQAPDGLVSHY